MTRGAIAAIAGIPVLLVTGCGSSGKGTSKAENGPIVVSGGSGPTTSGIFRLDPNGDVRRLTTDRDFAPTWSPDGKRIAFEESFGSRGELHLLLMSGDGTAVHQIGTVVADGYGASWAPDGSEIAFGDGRGVSVIKPDGTGLKQLVRQSPAEAPAWSPDGATIIYSRLARGLFAMHADGSGVRLFLRPPTSPRKHLYELIDPAWSPDGRRIAFVRFDLLAITKAHPSTIQVVNSDGTGERTLTHLSLSPPDPVRPTWSPDGSSIAFADRHGEQFGIWVVPSSGGTVRRFLSGIYGEPNWGSAGA